MLTASLTQAGPVSFFRFSRLKYKGPKLTLQQEHLQNKRMDTKKRTWIKTLVVGSAVLYALIMLKLLLFRDHSVGGHKYNLLPFYTIHNLLTYTEKYTWQEWYKNLAGNIVLFMPLGIYFPLWNKRLWQAGRLALTVIGVIFVVETLQIVTTMGTFDVDDIILNTFGALLGLMLMKALRLIRNNRRS